MHMKKILSITLSLAILFFGVLFVAQIHTSAMTSPSTISTTIKVGTTTTLKANFSPGYHEAIRAGSYRWTSSEPYNAAILDTYTGSTCVVTGKNPTLSSKGALITCTVSYYRFDMTGAYPTYEYQATCYFYVAVTGSVTPVDPTTTVHNRIYITYRGIESGKHIVEAYADEPHTIMHPLRMGLNYDQSKYLFIEWQDIKTLKTYRPYSTETFTKDTILDPVYEVKPTQKPTSAPATQKPTSAPATQKPTSAPATQRPTYDPSKLFLGDVDGDGLVTIFDATKTQRYLAGLSTIDDTHKPCADVDKDKIITIFDATAIQRKLAGIKVPYDIGKLLDSDATPGYG